MSTVVHRIVKIIRYSLGIFSACIAFCGKLGELCEIAVLVVGFCLVGQKRYINESACEDRTYSYNINQRNEVKSLFSLLFFQLFWFY